MRRILFIGAAALLLASPALRADMGVKPGPKQPGLAPQAPQAVKTKVTIEVDEKATEPRILIPMQVMFGGGALGFGGAAGAGGNIGAIGAAGNFGVQGVPANNLGQLGALGQAGGQAGLLGQAGGQPGVFGQLGGQQGTKPPKVDPPKKEEDPAPGQEQSQDSRQSSLPLSTMIVGLALALSLSTGGLWVARRKNTPGGMAPLTVLVAVLGLALAGGAVVWANGAPPFRTQPKPQPQTKPQPQPEVPGPLPTLAKFEGVKVEMIQEGDTIRLILPKRMAGQIKPIPKSSK